MEEQRIGRMYLKLALQRVARLWQGVAGEPGRRSSLFPALAVIVVLVVPGLVWTAHRHAQFHHLEQTIQGTTPQDSGPQPGGRAPLVLSRQATAGATTPEFLSMTLLPGLGMEVLQITAKLPGRGETALLSAPSLAQVADSGYQSVGGADDSHGALELPWSGNLEGLPSPVGMTQSETWRGRTVSTPTDPEGPAGILEGGLLRTRDVDAFQTVAVPDGAGATAQFGSTDFDEHWFSRTEMKVNATLRGSSIELKVTAKNVGDQVEPMGIGWHPRFSVVSGRRGEVTLRLPAADRLEYADKIRHTPSGKIVPMAAELQSFVSHPTPLGQSLIDEGLVQMKGSDSGPAAELRDAGGRYGLRMVGVSPSIKEMRVYVPADGSFVALGPQTNYDSPLQRNWMGDEGIASLQPGQSLEWTVRLEIFPVAGGGLRTERVEGSSPWGSSGEGRGRVLGGLTLQGDEPYIGEEAMAASASGEPGGRHFDAPEKA